jgi:CRP/FNR family transcriptional regulator
MDEKQLASFLQYMEVLQLLPNAPVFAKGDKGDAMFLVLQGELRARVMIDGRESTLAIMGVGECFGELAVIDESPRSADVIANSESVLLKISAEALKRLFQEAPSAGGSISLWVKQDDYLSSQDANKALRDSILFARTASQA